MGTLDGRVAIVTGGGRGLGREHALLFAKEGATVVVNDLGGSAIGDGSDISAAQSVVDEITAAGGKAVANRDSVTDWASAKRLIDTAVEEFGDLHVVVNNAGILRDRTLVNMTEEEFDTVVDVHLKGTFAVTRHAAAYWRDQAKAGKEIDRSLINTSSGSGLHGNPGQVNYASAKAGIAAMTQIAAKELERYHVRSNCIAPVARTRLTEATPGLGQVMVESIDKDFDEWHPANISPLVALLAAENCEFTGHAFRVLGGEVGLYQGWTVVDEVTSDARWTIEELAAATKHMPSRPSNAIPGKHADKMGK
ncbi:MULTISPECIES: SDR family oxidoreductase [Rhodococcus]|uniref:SDR family NAD(P)-dependent oxidoreductase n=1 Tax=Rhodococcus pseudokoreensis TaxID=2811421 RepID=A0A974ZU38_9NOCA|nr:MULTISPECIES: SDR family oxidoreductase [Rhodococcus]MBV6760729.1 SDR family NAD(P)-dependent oxidoreductase [Rhodococcus opacus]QSE89862.1 SDR family NAD(P)-dependent oxidoreductase [Rhodococcus pseudokoreensis]